MRHRSIDGVGGREADAGWSFVGPNSAGSSEKEHWVSVVVYRCFDVVRTSSSHGSRAELSAGGAGEGNDSGKHSD